LIYHNLNAATLQNRYPGVSLSTANGLGSTGEHAACARREAPAGAAARGANIM